MQGQIYPQSGDPELSYQRPSDWLPLPAVGQGEEKFVGLFAVYNNQSNFIALYFDGDYTVDWGDGTTEDFASGVTAEHSYTYGDIDPETLTSRGYRQVIVTVTPQTGADLTAMDLDIRHSNVSTGSSVSTNWLDIAISVPFCASLSISYNNYLGSLEIAKVIDAGLCTDLSYLFYYCYSLKKVVVEKADSAEDISYIFSGCSSLVYVELPDLPSLIIASSPFDSSYSLKEAIVGDVSSLGDFTDFFYNCESLASVTVKKLAGSGYDAFAYCYSLKSVSLLDLSELTDAYDMFYECYVLEKIYLPPMPLFSSMEYMFEYCYSLREVKFNNLESLTYVYQAFYECFSLEKVTLPEVPLMDDISYMFAYCYSLQNVQLPSIPLCDYLGSLFTDCYGLINAEVPEAMSNADLDLIFSYCYSLESAIVRGQPGYCLDAFYYCGSLRSVEFEDCSLVYNTTNMFSGCYRLASLRVPGLGHSVDISNCSLSKSALVQVFEDLAVVPPGSRYIVIYGNWGTPLLSPSDIQIATDKGWNVETSPCDQPPFYCNTSVNPYCVSNFSYAWASCTSITSFPLINVGSGTNFQQAWDYCTSLTSIPALNLSSGTNFYFAWRGCSSMTSFLPTDLSSGINFVGAWRDCTSLTSLPSMDTSSGQQFGGAWMNCTGLTSFPSLDTSSGINFPNSWLNCTGLTTFPTLNVSNGTNFDGAWKGCTGLTTFPTLNFTSGTTFYEAWSGCTNLTTFPAGVFDTCPATNFTSAWSSCNSLSQTSVDNILVSINAAGTTGGVLTLAGSPPGPAGVAAKSALISRGWSVYTN